jgi:hypothetical protein
VEREMKHQINRGKFFKTIGLGFFGFSILQLSPYRNFLFKTQSQKISVKPNTLAVKRQSTEMKNGK